MAHGLRFAKARPTPDHGGGAPTNPNSVAVPIGGTRGKGKHYCSLPCGDVQTMATPLETTVYLSLSAIHFQKPAATSRSTHERFSVRSSLGG